jgi:triacylglycerol lipase
VETCTAMQVYSRRITGVNPETRNVSMQFFSTLLNGLHLRFLVWLLALLGVVGGLPEAEAQELFGGSDPDAVPVLLVPGWGDQAPDVEPLRQWLIREGWPESRVAPVSFRNPVGSNEENAREVARAVEALRALTGAEKVDVVAHSMGGLALRHYLRFEGGDDEVRRAVFLGTPHRGTLAAVLAWGEGGREMVPGSEFLNRLNANGGVPAGVEALAIRTPVDLRVIPGSSGMLPDALNLEICCPTHNQLVDEERTAGAVVNFLRMGEQGVPDAERPGHRTQWSGSGMTAFDEWNTWADGWAERTVRRWLLPFQSDEWVFPNRLRPEQERPRDGG